MPALGGGAPPLPTRAGQIQCERLPATSADATVAVAIPLKQI